MTITLTREEAQQVLDALEAEHSAIYGTSQTVKATELLRARLAQPEPEPVQKTAVWNIKYPDYTAPPQRNWQGLTDEERQKCLSQGVDYGWLGIANAIETKLKEKNT